MPLSKLSDYSYLIDSDAIFVSCRQQLHQLLVQDTGENERCHDGGV